MSPPLLWGLGAMPFLLFIIRELFKLFVGIYNMIRKGPLLQSGKGVSPLQTDKGESGKWGSQITLGTESLTTTIQYSTTTWVYLNRDMTLMLAVWLSFSTQIWQWKHVKSVNMTRNPSHRNLWISHLIRPVRIVFHSFLVICPPETII